MRKSFFSLFLLHCLSLFASDHDYVEEHFARKIEIVDCVGCGGWKQTKKLIAQNIRLGDSINKDLWQTDEQLSSLEDQKNVLEAILASYSPIYQPGNQEEYNSIVINRQELMTLNSYIRFYYDQKNTLLQKKVEVAADLQALYLRHMTLEAQFKLKKMRQWNQISVDRFSTPGSPVASVLTASSTTPTTSSSDSSLPADSDHKQAVSAMSVSTETSVVLSAAIQHVQKSIAEQGVVSNEEKKPLTEKQKLARKLAKKEREAQERAAKLSQQPTVVVTDGPSTIESQAKDSSLKTEQVSVVINQEEARGDQTVSEKEARRLKTQQQQLAAERKLENQRLAAIERSKRSPEAKPLSAVGVILLSQAAASESKKAAAASESKKAAAASESKKAAAASESKKAAAASESKKAGGGNMDQETNLLLERAIAEANKMREKVPSKIFLTPIELSKKEREEQKNKYEALKLFIEAINISDSMDMNNVLHINAVILRMNNAFQFFRKHSIEVEALSKDVVDKSSEAIGQLLLIKSRWHANLSLLNKKIAEEMDTLERLTDRREKEAQDGKIFNLFKIREKVQTIHEASSILLQNYTPNEVIKPYRVHNFTVEGKPHVPQNNKKITSILHVAAQDANEFFDQCQNEGDFNRALIEIAKKSINTMYTKKTEQDKHLERTMQVISSFFKEKRIKNESDFLAALQAFTTDLFVAEHDRYETYQHDDDRFVTLIHLRCFLIHAAYYNNGKLSGGEKAGAGACS